MVALSHLINSWCLSLLLWPRSLSGRLFLRDVQSPRCSGAAERGGRAHRGVSHRCRDTQRGKERGQRELRAPSCGRAGGLCLGLSMHTLPQHVVVLTRGNLEILIGVTGLHYLKNVFKPLKSRCVRLRRALRMPENRTFP